MKPGEPPSGEGDGPARYRFDGIVVDAAAHTLVRDGQPQALEPKAFAKSSPRTRAVDRALSFILAAPASGPP